MPKHFTIILALSCTLGAAAVTTALAAQAPDGTALTAANAYVTRTNGQAILVMHRGAIVHEAYMHDGDASKRQLLASGSKSFVGVAAIAAVADGWIQLDAPVATYLREWKTDPRKSKVTVRQLLSLESGVETGGAGTGCGGRKATWSDAVAAPALHDPATTFAYGPFPFITMGAALERLHPTESFAAYLERRILAPLGIVVEWRMTCADGKPQLAGGAAMTARDWATFGEFIRGGGMYNGQRLLADSLVRQLFRPSTSNPSYGMSWWLRDATVEQNPAAGPQHQKANRIPRRRPRAIPRRASEVPAWIPRDLVMAAGAGDQRLYVIPSRELVIVRLGPVVMRGTFDDVDFLATLLRPSRR